MNELQVDEVEAMRGIDMKTVTADAAMPNSNILSSGAASTH